MKAKGDINPSIEHTYLADGKELKCWRGLKLKDVKGRIAKYGVMDIDISWPFKGGVLEARLIVSRLRKDKTLGYLLTNLPRDAFSVADVVDAYRLRWQIELMFKEWKSHANLHAFDTSNPYIAEGLITGHTKQCRPGGWQGHGPKYQVVNRKTEGAVVDGNTRDFRTHAARHTQEPGTGR